MLPAFNEEHALRPMMEKIDRVMKEMGAAYRVVVVNDGSSDATALILKELVTRYPLHTITHKINRGLGETARDGFEFVAETAHPSDVLVRMDCDDTHEPRYIPLLLQKLNEGFEVVTTSRYAPGGGVVGLDWYRRSISRCANLLFKTFFPIPKVWEYTCGYRAYRVALLQDAIAIFGNKFIDLKGMGFTGTLEKLIKCKMMGARIAEIPYVLRYDQKLSSSKVLTAITTLGCLLLILKHAFIWKGEPEHWQQLIKERKARVYSRELPNVSILSGAAPAHGPAIESA
ncbi:MAG: glycosyltransferase [Gemmatimonadaceae bacterium]